ncbi:hypothetical protein DYBT9275_01540 [Dyadobacter sp. CECT 9275]|uniref:Uncharacterized protein n=1 Tax=Dyadobacter helix TaxID=2822344 RepID=A0A916J9K9_9BACT|nr:hypothetical protein DYBT9275_01540 [Dyadobacter sp. CECT 9275]
MGKPLFLANSNSFYKKLKRFSLPHNRHNATRSWLPDKIQKRAVQGSERPEKEQILILPEQPGRAKNHCKASCRESGSGIKNRNKEVYFLKMLRMR